MSIYREMYEDMIKRSNDLPEYGESSINFINPELLKVGGEKMSPKDIINLKENIDYLLEYLGYCLQQVMFYDIPLNGNESKFHKSTPAYHQDDDEYYEIHGDFSFLFNDAVTENELMANNNIVAKRLESKYKKLVPNNTIDFDSECSSCFFQSNNKNEMIDFRNWMYDIYIKPYIEKLKKELQIHGFFNKTDGYIEFSNYFDE